MAFSPPYDFDDVHGWEQVGGSALASLLVSEGGEEVGESARGSSAYYGPFGSTITQRL